MRAIVVCNAALAVALAVLYCEFSRVRAEVDAVRLELVEMRVDVEAASRAEMSEEAPGPNASHSTDSRPASRPGGFEFRDENTGRYVLVSANQGLLAGPTASVSPTGTIQCRSLEIVDDVGRVYSRLSATGLTFLGAASVDFLEGGVVSIRARSCAPRTAGDHQ